MKDIDRIADFLFETGILAKTPRSYFHFLGGGSQSVAEHINRVVFIGYTLASVVKNVDMLKVLKMCLLHDLSESRISDLNYVHQKYTERQTDKAVEDLASTLPFGQDIKETLEEYEARETIESQLAKDADQLEFIISLKEQIDTGNSRAETWLPPAIKRLQTEPAKELANKIIDTPSDNWWFSDKDDEWWVSRNKKFNF